MRNVNRTARRILKALVFVAITFPLAACGPGTVYVGVVAPGPWVGYPPGGVYGGYPGAYGRPWYSPVEEETQGLAAAGENEESITEADKVKRE